MTITIGERLPDATLQEFIDVEGNGCSIGPNKVNVEEAVRGKKLAIFGLPGAVHADLLGAARAGLHQAVRRAQGQGHRRRSGASRSTTRS